MLIKAKTLDGFHLEATDGQIGSTKDLYFDDRFWAIRYLVADTGSWLSSRSVLLSPYSVTGVVQERNAVVFKLTKRQIEDSPSLDTDKPVSQQFENTYYAYYGFPIYWGGPYMWGNYPTLMWDHNTWEDTHPDEKQGDTHLRSVKTVEGYHVHATDGHIGHISEFLIDEETWAIRYLVVDTRTWWVGKHILLAPKWIDRVSWDESKVFVNLTREEIENSPEYDDETLVTRSYEADLYAHYKKPGYWTDDSVDAPNLMTPSERKPDVSLY